MTIGTNWRAGALVFASMLEAKRAGFEPETRFAGPSGAGWIVRKRVSGLWARALVLQGGAR